ncbi:MAG TPA: DUF3109 family protein [Candidatus Kapabacteria bacterium]|nr:DUF3109 family protein [Candidatus Kapabacteria bacterium]
MPDPKSIELPIYSESAHFTVDLALGKTKFACDLDVCHGACCTMPADAGAPILESEIAELERVFPIVKKYLSEESLATIAKEGLWKREADGSLTIPAIRGRDCVFVTYEEEPGWKHRPTRGPALPTRTALCAIEKAYHSHEIEGFPKPISCHLFPIRIYPNGENKYEIVYEEISECKGGRARGKREKIPLLDFLESPLVRALGEDRVKRLRAALLNG